MTGGALAAQGPDHVAILSGWQVTSTPPGAAVEPNALGALDSSWLDTTAPMTAAGALRAAGRWSLDEPPRRFDGEDWWWRVCFTTPEAEAGDELALCLDGLATVAEVWLDGAPLLTSTNMFRRYERPVTRGPHELVIVCRALDAALEARRPRPRWRAPMVEHQRLCWFRTTLLGRTPGWSPPAAAVGPWRPVRVERRRRVAVDAVALRPSLEGAAGRLMFRGRVRSLGAETLSGALEVERAGVVHAAALQFDGADARAEVEVPDVARWWPHTHGEPCQYEACLRLTVGADELRVPLGRVGFREIAVDTTAGDFAMRVNGVDVFCRGACWTPLDPVALRSDAAAYRSALTQARDAGMNMLRVGGTMVYEDDAFHDLADELGLMVWQDLMFANMDYPTEAAFVEDVEAEITQLLTRIAHRPSTVLLCGNSEGEQQAAMWGAPRAAWSHPLFDETIPGWLDRLDVSVPYWPSSAHGGAFPHQGDHGTTSYYGVGAYLRPLDDARRARVRFASECLAFANVPRPSTVERMPGGHLARVHQSGWKSRTPRDLGAGWDFDDVRDHYVRVLFDVDPLPLRYADHDRYLALGRVATGELMAATFGEWRTAASPCRGGLVWFLRDLWRGAGWGVIDADGVPKSVYHYLRRVLQPVALHLTDEGTNGVGIHVFNDGPEPLSATLRLELFRGAASVGEHEQALSAPPHSALALNATSLLEGFFDIGNAYRFGPPGCDVVAATLRRGDSVVARAFHLPLGLSRPREAELGLVAEANVQSDGDVELSLRARAFAQAVSLDVPGFAPDDDFFHLAPGDHHTVRLRRESEGAPLRPKGKVTPLNALSSTPITIIERGP